MMGKTSKIQCIKCGAIVVKMFWIRDRDIKGVVCKKCYEKYRGKD